MYINSTTCFDFYKSFSSTIHFEKGIDVLRTHKALLKWLILLLLQCNTQYLEILWKVTIIVLGLLGVDAAHNNKELNNVYFYQLISQKQEKWWAHIRHRMLYSVLKLPLHVVPENLIFCLVAQSICNTLLVYKPYLPRAHFFFNKSGVLITGPLTGSTDQFCIISH
jgi:hypothetical protein